MRFAKYFSAMVVFPDAIAPITAKVFTSK